jgi:hypothetical protein
MERNEASGQGSTGRVWGETASGIVSEESALMVLSHHLSCRSFNA